MRAALVLLVLVVMAATQVSETEAGWFRRAIRNVGRFIKDHVRVRVGISRQFRAAEKTLASLGCPMEQILHKYGCYVEGDNTLDKEVAAAIFEESDADQDKTLSEEEAKTFELLFLKQILTMCLEKRAPDAAENLV